jgi:capsular polysaccharide biosynthesis protein
MMNEENIRIQDILDIIKKRWKLIVGITFIFTAFVAIMSFFVIAPKYESSTKLFIGKENSQDQKYDNNDVQMYQKLLTTYAEIITTNDLVEKALNEDNLNLESGDVLKSLVVIPRADTQILEIKYVSADNVQSKKVVESITNQFMKTSDELIPNGRVKIIENVKLPEKPISPNKKLNIAVAFLLGFMISIGLTFLLEFLDSTFKTKEQLENIVGVPVIGIIPDEDKVK